MSQVLPNSARAAWWRGAAPLWRSSLCVAGLALFATACTGDSQEGPGAPPPVGYPFVPAEYTLLAVRIQDDCGWGDLSFLQRETRIDWRQDGIELRGSIEGEGSSTQLQLRGRLCADEAPEALGTPNLEKLRVHWQGYSLGQSALVAGERCRVELSTPPRTTQRSRPQCESEGENFWWFSECGALVGEAQVRLSMSAGCDRPRSCTLTLRSLALPEIPHPEAAPGQRLRCSAQEISALKAQHGF